MSQGLAIGAIARPSPLATFKVRSFRYQWPADLLTSWAFEMETLILGWYVLVETGSVMMLTAFASLQYIGTLISPMFGVAGDRVGHRNLLCGMRAAYALLAATLAALALSGVLTPVHVFVIAALSGMVRPSDLAMRNALIGETVPASQLTGAMSVSRTTQDSARVIGAITGAGVFAVLGMGAAYLCVAVFYALGLLLTLAIGDARKAAAGSEPPAAAIVHPSPWRSLADGLAYVWRSPALLAGMLLAFLVNLTAFPVTSGLMPYVAKEVYRVDQTMLGYMVASFAFGALLGSITQSFASNTASLTRRMIVCTLAWYAMLLVFAAMPTAQSGMAVLVCAGFAQSLSMVPLAIMLISTSDPRFRGRVMGVRMLAIYGLPIGLLGAGALIARIGYAATSILYCAIGIAFTLLIAVCWRAALWQRPAQDDLQR